MPKQRKQSLFSSLFHFKRNTASFHQQPERSNHPADLGGSNTCDGSVKLENFLLEEYKHRSAFIMQVLQDITASVNVYFFLAGLFVSGLGLAYQFGTFIQPYLEPVLLVFLLVFAVIHFFFFIRFVSFGFVYQETIERMDVMRAFYVRQFQPQTPTIGEILRSDTDPRSFYTVFLPVNSLLSFLLALIASLCFAGVVFLGSELWFHINNGALFPLPSDIRPYSMGLLVGSAVFLLQILYYRFIRDISRKLKTT